MESSYVDLTQLTRAVETADLEFKSAQGGLPGSFWETYSAFANTSGGTVILGVAEDAGGYSVLGVPNIPKLRKTLFDCLNDRHKTSVNVLRERDVTEMQVAGRRLLSVAVPQATRTQRPVFINGDMLNGSFIRLDAGDYRCSPEMVRRMVAESLGSRDDRILEAFGIEDIDRESLASYRALFRQTQRDHPWLALEDVPFLTQVGALRRDRDSTAEGLTVAGLLMFGTQRSILDAFSHYQVDYREADDDDPDVRWTYRHTVDGRWSPNLLEFYQRTVARLTRDVSIPFRLQGLQRDR